MTDSPTLCAEVRNDDLTTQVRDFGVIDMAGRPVGAIANLSTSTFAPVPAGRQWGRSMKPGTYFALKCWATRDGKEFGATQHTRYFETAELRERALTKYWAEAAKRAAKQFTKGA